MKRAPVIPIGYMIRNIKLVDMGCFLCTYFLFVRALNIGFHSRSFSSNILS